MKLSAVNAPISVDRLATPDEIRAAVLPIADTIEEYTREILCEIAADFGGYVRISDLEFETSVLVEALIQKQDAWNN